MFIRRFFTLNGVFNSGELRLKHFELLLDIEKRRLRRHRSIVGRGGGGGGVNGVSGGRLTDAAEVAASVGDRGVEIGGGGFQRLHFGHQRLPGRLCLEILALQMRDQLRNGRKWKLSDLRQEAQ